MNFTKRTGRFKLAFWLCAGVVLTLSLTPNPQALPSTGWDKSNHLLAFAVLGYLGFCAYANAARVILGLLAFGALIEGLQSLGGHRFAEWGDWIADGLGIALAYTLRGISALRARDQK